MSISSETRKAGPYAGNGVTTNLPFSFKIFSTADVRVVQTDPVGAETDLTLTTHYTVSLNADQDANPGGTVVMVTAPATGYYTTLTSKVQNLQAVTITNLGGFYPKILNDALDRLTIMVQQVAEQVSRAVKVGISSSSTPDQLIDAINTAASTASAAATSASGSAASASASAASASASASAISTYPASVQSQAFTRFTAGGTVDAMTGTLSPAIASYTAGLRVTTTPGGANTVTGPTLNLNSLGAKTIKKRDASGSKVALVAGDYNASGPFDFEYDGTDFVLLNPLLQSSGSSFVTNKVINGGFSINQRLATSVADDAYCLDRWYVLTETGNVTVAQQTDQENGTPHNIRLTQPDVSAKRVALAQIIESRDCKDLRGKVASLGLRLRNSTGGQINYAILEWSGTADSVTSDVISAWAGSPTYIGSITERANGTLTPSANTWTDATAISGTINAAANNLIVLIWSNGTFAQNATLDIGRVQLEEGTATAFKARPIEQELALCQRYFEKSWDLASSIGATTADGAEAIRQSVTSEDKTLFNASFRVRKRAVPTVTWYNPNTGSSGQIYDVGAAASRTVTGTYANAPVSETKVGAPTHSSIGTAGNIIWAHWTASAEL